MSSSQEDENEFYSEEAIEEKSQTTQVEVDFAPDRYRVIDSSEVMDRMAKAVKKVKAIVGESLSNCAIRNSLNKYKWDTERFLEQFYMNESPDSPLLQETSTNPTIVSNEAKKENKDPVKTSAKKNKKKAADVNTTRLTRSQARKRESSIKLGLSESIDEPPRKIRISALSSQNSSGSTADSSNEFTCEICFDIANNEDIHTWKCNHKFCKACFKSYLVEKINNSACLAVIQCPGFKCETILSDDEIMKSLTYSQRGKYFQVITNEFVLSNRMLRWCPGKDCVNAIEMIDLVKQPAVRCLCGHHFCFSCSHFVHDLISCEVMKKFELLKSKDFASANWIASNCKQCPKCKSEINKNGGCNHMTCRQCSHEFCWICNSDWRTHGHTTCRGVRGNSNDLSVDHHGRRLVGCVSKHGSMVDSIKRDEDYYKKYMKLQEMQAKDQWFKVEFIKHAIDTILKCRRLLCDSYILEFFMEDQTNSHWMCFEMNQKDLQQATEGLSSLMENEVNEDNYHEMKQILIKNTNYCNNLYKAVYEISKDGFENNLWKKI